MTRQSRQTKASRAPTAGAEEIRSSGFFGRGRRFTPRQLLLIEAIVERHRSEGRTAISERVCRALRWNQPNGSLKDMACREILRKLDAAGVISLPAPKWGGAAWASPNPQSVRNGTHTPIAAIDRAAICIHRVESKYDGAAAIWNSLIQQHHYLHTSRIVGRQIKYLVYHEQQPIACFGWGDAAWAQQSRDRWIGWSSKRREQRRHLIINNCRFLILPWVRVPNLASFLISRCTDAVVRDWELVYGWRPVLLETFVDSMRFMGTCYRAANWVDVGVTSGYAKVGSGHHNSQTPKLVFLYPANGAFRKLLTGKKR